MKHIRIWRHTGCDALGGPPTLGQRSLQGTWISIQISTSPGWPFLRPWHSLHSATQNAYHQMNMWDRCFTLCSSVLIPPPTVRRNIQPPSSAFKYMVLEPEDHNHYFHRHVNQLFWGPSLFSSVRPGVCRDNEANSASFNVLYNSLFTIVQTIRTMWSQVLIVFRQHKHLQINYMHWCSWI
jgi:hypothetical protein